MFSITTTVSHNASGAGTIVAKGHGRQKTTRVDHSKSDEQNRASAMGALLNLLTTPVQQAKVKHPTGAQRVRVDALSDFGGKHRWTINV